MTPTDRGQPHLPREDPHTPGVCVHCHRPTGTPNDRHIQTTTTADPQTRAAGEDTR